MVWFWIGSGLAAVGLTAWARWLSRRPGAAGWIKKIALAPLVVWILSVGVAVFFTWKVFHDLEAADASEKAFLMAQNITWAMNATLAGIIGLGIIAVVLLVVNLRAVGPGPGPGPGPGFET
jgi:hypothetical protein